MKKTMLFIVLAAGLLSYSFNKRNEQNVKVENTGCNYGQCIAIKKDGYGCRNCAQQGSSYCWSHNR
jgi:hypothetical protein